MRRLLETAAPTCETRILKTEENTPKKKFLSTDISPVSRSGRSCPQPAVQAVVPLRSRPSQPRLVAALRSEVLQPTFVPVHPGTLAGETKAGFSLCCSQPCNIRSLRG